MVARRACHKTKTGAPTISRIAKPTNGIGGGPTTSMEMHRPTPPRKIMPQITRNKTVCLSIPGMSQYKARPNPSHTPLKNRRLLSSNVFADDSLIEAVHFLKATFPKGKPLGHYAETAIPTRCVVAHCLSERSWCQFSFMASMSQRACALLVSSPRSACKKPFSIWADKAWRSSSVQLSSAS